MLQEMSLISSIVRTLSGASDPDGLLKSYESLRQISSGPNSLSKKAKNGIFEYPFLISSNLSDIEGICSIIKGMETEYGNMMLISMGINPSIKNDTNYEIQRTLSNYHTNGNDFAFKYEDAYQKLIETKTINEVYRLKKRIGLEAAKIISLVKRSNRNYNSRSSGGIKIPPQQKPLPQMGNTGIDPDDVSHAKDETQFDFDAKTNKISDKYAAMFNATMISVTLRMGDTENSKFTIPIGLKGIPHLLPASDLMYIIGSFAKTRKAGTLNRYIRWRSGEIKGLHNLLFRYDEIKADADFDRRVGTNHSWLKVLKSRANNRKVNLLAKVFSSQGSKEIKTADILPNCTFVISISDVDTIENETSVNLFTQPAATSKLLDDAMGLGICIIDETTNVAHIMYSGYDKFTSYPISSLKSKPKSEGDLTKVMLDIMKKI